MDNLLGLFELALGGYLIYCAITGKGQIYKSENIKKGMEKKYAASMRLFSAFLGPLMAALGLLDYFSSRLEGAWVRPALFALWGVSLLGMAALVTVAIRLTDRSKPQKPQNPEKPSSRAAFEFDDDDKKENQ